MTNKECKIKNLRLSWGDLLLKKETLLKEIWEIECKMNLIKENLLRYGVSEKNPRMGSDETNVGESDHLNNCFTYNDNTPVHEL